MQAAFEHVGTTTELSWKLGMARDAEFRFAWHFHPELELTLISRGTGRRFVGDSVEPYAAGDLVLVGPDLPHTYVSDTPGQEAVVCQFRADFLGDALLERPEFALLGDLLSRAHRGLAFPSSPDVSAAVRRLDELNGPLRTLGLLGVLVELAGANSERALATAEFRPRRRDDVRQRMDAVFTFVHSSYAEPIEIAKVASVAHLSPAAFSRFFRRTTGHTFTAYLSELRIGAACRLLIETDLTVAAISVRSGFHNLANFNRQFRAAKRLSPRQYRAQYVPTVSEAR